MSAPTLPKTITITLITGANKGLGYETARRLLEAGHTVLLGARDAQRGQRAADELGTAFIPIDVTDEASVGAAADQVRERYGRLDVLINNAGIVGPRRPLPDVIASEVLTTLDTNVLGVVRVTHAFLSLLRAAENPRIVNVSSGTGRLTWQHKNGWPQEKAPPIYSMSKAALTMLTLQYAHALPGILINVAWPGYTATDLNDHQGTQTVTEGTDAIVRLATLPPDGPTGTFQGRGGTTTPW
jgi:NAD(P)-dependent dehydrogenase (short-subunit alcohol dehydrogenase family)